MADRPPRAVDGTPGAPPAIDDVLDFWFAPATKPHWFRASDPFDEAVRTRLGAAHRAAAGGDPGLGHWPDSPHAALARVILLDQVPRNLYRGTAEAFAFDAAARWQSLRALALRYDEPLGTDERLFLYLPLEHSEDLEHQRLSVRLFRERVGEPTYVDFAERHLAIIERFGRFPRRNAALDRTSTEAERAFLAEPGVGF